MRRKNKIPNFIDGKKYFLRWGRYRDGSEIVYKRISDESMSLGTIKWFEKTNDDRIVITVIDNILNNYQACYFEDIFEKVDSKTRKKLIEKMTKS